MPASVQTKVSEFFARYPKRSYPKGQILIHAGDQPDKIHYLQSGKVKQYDISYRGDEVIVNVFKTGAFYPMLWAMLDSPNQFFFAADESVEIRLAPRDEVLTFLKRNPDVMYDLLERVYRGMDGVLGRMVHLMTGSAKSRLLYELIIEAKRFGEKTSDGLKLQVNETDLAARAGLSRETVSREISKLSDMSLVDVSHSKIIVKDLEGLAIKLSKTV